MNNMIKLNQGKWRKEGERMRIKKILVSLLIGGVVMTSGCSQIEKQKQQKVRNEVEQEFYKLDTVYPTSSLEELMEKFPGKEIQINHFVTKKQEEGKIYSYYMSFKIDKEKNITGKVEVEDTTETLSIKLNEYNLVYNKKTKKFEREDGEKVDDVVKNIKFLFQMLDVKNNPLKDWNNTYARSIENINSYSLVYEINNEEISKYIGFENSEIKLHLSGSDRLFIDGDIGTFQISNKNSKERLLEGILIKN